MHSVNHDAHRESRTGIPEVILAEPKAVIDMITAVEHAMEKNNRALITRLREDQYYPLFDLIEKNDWKHEIDNFKRTVMIYTHMWEIESLSAAIFSAGTSDRYVVEEIRFCMRFFGWNTEIFMDVGVAGLHRFQQAIDGLSKDNLCLILVAGQDGALFPVVTGQTSLPVIACPTAIGYGYGGKGETALRSALQSCAPGIAVVNIDNGFGAASMAAKILSTFKKFRK